ncbi:hypothetical protein ABL78_5182 [Leptomonas seymouri]|uniref:Cytochrome b5 heme-binding domain-containing protein n=1 Tax=Leptomonas seymouri TaxID=5684 RepID=A0A0N1PDM0_LEPSE|nr:hypothetical protein ABL78_5182 [Leptomonas seymouri]|eukprot:KPI85764.1 hypothetical protein ABL78_5182 [Leptomonas seymouri]
MSDGERFRFFYRGKAYLIPQDYIDDEHPGGGDAIWPWVNKDMTDAFDDADHSLGALELLEEYLDEDYDPHEDSLAAAVAAAAIECESNDEDLQKVSLTETTDPAVAPPSPVKVGRGEAAVSVVVSTAVAAVVVIAAVAVMSKVMRKHR